MGMHNWITWDFAPVTGCNVSSHRRQRARVHHLAHRTCDWTPRLKPLPTTRTRHSPHKTVMGMPRCITWDFALVTGRNVSSHCTQRARGSKELTCETIELGRSTTGRCCEPKNATSEATADNVIISWELIPTNPCYDNSYHRWASSTTPEPQGPLLSLKCHPETSTLAFLHW